MWVDPPGYFCREPGRLVTEGLLIVGWVAVWRPLEIFLYEWWSIRRRCRIPAKLARIPVTVRASEGKRS